MNTYSSCQNMEQDQHLLSEQAFQELKEIVYARSGIFFGSNSRILLENHLLNHLQSSTFSHFHDYIKFIIEHPTNAEELKVLLDAVTVTESAFFRNPFQLNAFKEVILPTTIKKKNQQPFPVIRLLSAGCAHGEEPYSIAMIIHQHFLNKLQNFKVEIIAIDINEQALDVAIKGVYRDYALKNLPEEYLQKYFLRSGSKYVINDDIRQSVTFRYANLMEARVMAQLGRFDIIFCCNVLLYLDKPARMKVVNTLYNMLNPEGYFFIGQSESLHGIARKFKLHLFNKAIAYKKEREIDA